MNLSDTAGRGECGRSRKPIFVNYLEDGQFGHGACKPGTPVGKGVQRSEASGFALIDLIFVCGVIGILATTAMPKLLVARQAAGASSAIGSMRAINSAQLTYAFTCG